MTNYIPSGVDEVKKLDMTGNSNFMYYILINVDGKILNIRASNGTFSYSVQAVDANNPIKLEDIDVMINNSSILDDDITYILCLESEGTYSLPTHEVTFVAGYGISNLAYGSESGSEITLALTEGSTFNINSINATYLTDFSGKKAYIKNPMLNGFTLTEIDGNSYTVGESDVTILIDPAYPRKCYCNNGVLSSGVTCNIGLFTYRYKYKATATGWSSTTLSENGWGVRLIDKNSTSPITETMCGYINDMPLANTMHAFSNSKASTIDVTNYYTKNVTQMTYMFQKA